MDLQEASNHHERAPDPRCPVLGSALRGIREYLADPLPLSHPPYQVRTAIGVRVLRVGKFRVLVRGG